MAQKTTSSIYESLARVILPEGILDLFGVTNVEEEHTGIIQETGLELRIIHIYLAERDLRGKEWHDLTPNGFTEAKCINSRYVTIRLYCM
jgi:transposase